MVVVKVDGQARKVGGGLRANNFRRSSLPCIHSGSSQLPWPPREKEEKFPRALPSSEMKNFLAH